MVGGELSPPLPPQQPQLCCPFLFSLLLLGLAASRVEVPGKTPWSQSGGAGRRCPGRWQGPGLRMPPPWLSLRWGCADATSGGLALARRGCATQVMHARTHARAAPRFQCFHERGWPGQEKDGRGVQGPGMEIRGWRPQ